MPYQSNRNLSRLLLQSGEARANAELQRGEIWGNAISNIGNIAGRTLTDLIQYKADAPKREAETMRMDNIRLENEARRVEAQASGTARQIQGSALKQTEDGTWTYDRDLMARAFQVAGIADRLPGVMEGLDAFDASARAVNQAKREGLAGLAYGVTQLGNTPQAFNQAIDLALKNGFITRSDVGPILQQVGDDPAKIGQVVTQLASLSPAFSAKLGPQAQKLHNVAPGASVIDANNPAAGPVFTAPANEPKGPVIGTFEDFVTQKYGPRPTPEQIAEGRKVYQQADDRPRAEGTPGLTPNAESMVVSRLANQWTAASKPTREMDRQVGIMKDGIKAARAGNLNAGGQAVLVTFQKILDPTSVVRESEFDRSREGQALMQRAQGAYERLTKGGPGVPLAELEKYAALAEQIANTQKTSRLSAIQERIGKTADRYKIPRELVFEAEPPAAAPTAGSGPVVVQAPDGQTYSFPNAEKAEAFKKAAGIR